MPDGFFEMLDIVLQVCDGAVNQTELVTVSRQFKNREALVEPAQRFIVAIELQQRIMIVVSCPSHFERGGSPADLAWMISSFRERTSCHCPRRKAAMAPALRRASLTLQGTTVSFSPWVSGQPFIWSRHACAPASTSSWRAAALRICSR